MENFVKRYFWLINVVMLTVMAYLTARLASNVVAGAIVAIHTLPKAKERPAPAPTASNETTTWARTITRRNIFNANPPVDPPDGGEPGADGGEPGQSGLVPGPNDACKSSDAKMALVMTMVAEPVASSMAVLRDAANRTSRRGRRRARPERPGPWPQRRLQIL